MALLKASADTLPRPCDGISYSPAAIPKIALNSMILKDFYHRHIESARYAQRMPQKGPMRLSIFFTEPSHQKSIEKLTH